MSDIEVFKPKTSPIDVLNNYKFTEDEIKRLEYVYTREWDLYVKGLTQFIDQSILDKVKGIKLCVSKITTGDPDKWIDTNEVFSEAKRQAFVKWLFKSHIMALRDCDRAIGNSIDHHLPILFRIYINEGRYKRLLSEDLPETAKIEDFNKLTKLTIDTLNEAIGPYFELDVVSGVTTEDRFQYIPVNVKMKTIYQKSEDTYIKSFLAHLVAERNKQTGLEEFHPMYNIEKSSENILKTIQIGFGAVLMAYCIFVFIIVPIYKHTPLYKYIENKRKEKEKEIEKQRQKDRKIEINERNKLVQELKTNPQLKHLQSEIKRTADLANSFGKSLVPVLRAELKKIDPKNYIEVFDCSSDSNVTDKMTDVLWDMCFEIAKAVKNKTDVDVFFECNSFGIDGLKQYTIDDDNDDSDNRKFNKVFESTVENHCRKFKIPGISVESEGYGDCNDTIYYNCDWGGDHHGTIQSLVNMIHLDFSNDTGREDLEYSEELFGFGKKKIERIIESLKNVNYMKDIKTIANEIKNLDIINGKKFDKDNDGYYMLTTTRTGRNPIYNNKDILKIVAKSALSSLEPDNTIDAKLDIYATPIIDPKTDLKEHIDNDSEKSYYYKDKVYNMVKDHISKACKRMNLTYFKFVDVVHVEVGDPDTDDKKGKPFRIVLGYKISVPESNV